MPSTTAAPSQEAGIAPAGHHRWMIIGLLFVITTINYMDRNLLGVLKPTIQGDLHFSETDYGNIVFAFSMAYAAGYASMGAFSDKVGVRIGLAVAAMSGVRPPPRTGWLPRWPASPPHASPSVSVRAAISPPASKPSPHGSRCATAPLPPVSSTPAAT